LSHNEVVLVNHGAEADIDRTVAAFEGALVTV
jgi:hypothetical protein